MSIGVGHVNETGNLHLLACPGYLVCQGHVAILKAGVHLHLVLTYEW